MNSKVKATVTYEYSKRLTEYFDSSCSVRQGCTLSPILFSSFINELVISLEEKFDDEIFITAEMLNIIALFADDLILVTDSVIKLQQRLEALYLYSHQWGIDINIYKSKIIVFKMGGPLSKYKKMGL